MATLVRAKADVNAQDKDGWTALMEASLKNHQEITKMLRQAGASINPQSQDLSTLDQLRTLKRKKEFAKKIRGSFVGVMDKDAIRRVVKKNLVQLKNCYEKLAQRKRDSSGRVELGWDIHSGGRVCNVKIVSSQIKDQEMLNCMKLRLASWRFPDPPEGVIGEVTYPFVFALSRQ